MSGFGHVFKGREYKTVTPEMHEKFVAGGYQKKSLKGKDPAHDMIFKDAESDGLVVYEKQDNYELLSYIAGDELLRLTFPMAPDIPAAKLDVDTLFGKKIVTPIIKKLVENEKIEKKIDSKLNPTLASAISFTVG